MKLGIVTYQVAKDWDLDTMIDMCQKTGFEAVECEPERLLKYYSRLWNEWAQ